MPRSVVEAGLSDGSVPLDGMARAIMERDMSAKILVVDDSGLARRGTRRMLEGAGYEVVEAEDGMAALERYFVEKPDLVLLDLVMKGMYGLDVLTKLRELDAAARVIVVSADIQTSSREMVSAAGAAGFLNKPVDGRGADCGGARRARRAGVMELTTAQQDALVELLNIGFGRAAASLSQLTGHRVLLEVPQVSIHPIGGARRGAVEGGHGGVASVHQIFSGPVAGDALLILDHEAAGC